MITIDRINPQCPATEVLVMARETIANGTTPMASPPFRSALGIQGTDQPHGATGTTFPQSRFGPEHTPFQPLHLSRQKCLYYHYTLRLPGRYGSQMAEATQTL